MGISRGTAPCLVLQLYLIMAAWPPASCSGTLWRSAGAPASSPTTRAHARPASAGPTRPAAAASAPRAPSAGSAAGPPFARSRRGLGPRPDGRQDRQREHRQRDVPVPAQPTPHLVLVQPAVPLGPLEALLH